MKKKNYYNPPRIALWLLETLIPKFNQYGVKGDFTEKFNYFIENKNPFYAYFWIWYSVIRAYPGYIKNSMIWNFSMIINYWKIAVRNFNRYRGYSLINIFGLSVGMASCIIIALFVINELNYDKYYIDGDRIFRVVSQTRASIQVPAGPALLKDYPEIEMMTRILPHEDYLGIPFLQFGDKKFLEKRVYYADPNILEMFEYDLIKGDIKTALIDQNSIVITTEMAEKYFGDEDPMDKIITYQSQLLINEFKVTGIIDKRNLNSHFDFDFLLHINRQQNVKNSEQNWVNSISYTYVKLSVLSNPEELEGKLSDFVDRYYSERMKFVTDLDLQNIADIHLRSKLDSEFKINGNVLYIYIFISIVYVTGKNTPNLLRNSNYVFCSKYLVFLCFTRPRAGYGVDLNIII